MKAEQGKLPIKASVLEGYETVSDLIPDGHFLQFTELWALRLEHFIAEDGALERRLVLDLGEGLEPDDRPLIRVTMLRPQQCTLPDTRQIIGLAFQDIRQLGWEGLYYRVFDYETTDFDVTCHSIRLSRLSKPAL